MCMFLGILAARCLSSVYFHVLSVLRAFLGNPNIPPERHRSIHRAPPKTFCSRITSKQCHRKVSSSVSLHTTRSIFRRAPYGPGRVGSYHARHGSLEFCLPIPVRCVTVCYGAPFGGCRYIAESLPAVLCIH